MDKELYSFTLWRSSDEMQVVLICKANSYHEAEKKAKDELDKWNRTSTNGDYKLLTPEWRDIDALEAGAVVFVG